MSSLWSCLIQIKLLLGNLKYITFPRYLSIHPQCLSHCVSITQTLDCQVYMSSQPKKPFHGYPQTSHPSCLSCWGVNGHGTSWKQVISQENDSEGKFPPEDSTTEKSEHFGMNDRYYQSIKFPSQSLLCIDINDTGPYVTSTTDKVWNINQNSQGWNFHLKKKISREEIKCSQKL